MKKATARAYQRTPMLWLGGVLSILSVFAMLWGNLASMAGASFSQLAVYVILPTLASAGLGVMLFLRISPLWTVLPAALGCTIYVMLESYLTVLVTDPGSFASVWSYLGSANICCILAASLCMAFGCLLYILCAMGVLHSDLLPMAFLGIAAVALLSEYLLTILGGAYSASPWYMISAVLFLLSLIVSIVCFDPAYASEKASSHKNAAANVRGKASPSGKDVSNDPL